MISLHWRNKSNILFSCIMFNLSFIYSFYYSNGVEFKFEENENELNEDEKYYTALDDGKEINGSFMYVN